MPDPVTTDAPVIAMQDIAVVASLRPGEAVLEDLNWQVAAGEFWAVRGGQHSGKTTVVELAAGLRVPLRGTCRIFGTCLADRNGEDDLAIRRRIGVVFDGGGRLFPQLTLAENIRLPVRYHAEEAGVPDESWADEMMALLELGDDAQRLPRNISPARRQRAALARALVLQPRLLLLDNPLGNIDPIERPWWIERINGLVDGSSGLCPWPLTVITTVSDSRDSRDLSAREAHLAGRRLRISGSEVSRAF